MMTAIEVIVPNRFRDFDVYPIEERQVELLMESMKADGHWGGLPARKVGDKYEIACGHHRLEAARRLGIKKIALDVQKRSDAQMISIMVKENMLQRGHENFGAVLDSVGAIIVQVVETVYGNGEPGSNWPPVSWGQVQDNINKGDGVGKKIICRLESSIGPRIAKQTIAVLKATNYYHSLIEKGGAPPEIVALYENPNPMSSLAAMAQFRKGYQAVAWVETMFSINGLLVFPISQHETMVQQLLNHGLYQKGLSGEKVRQVLAHSILTGRWLKTATPQPVPLTDVLFKLCNSMFGWAERLTKVASKIDGYAGILEYDPDLVQGLSTLKESIITIEGALQGMEKPPSKEPIMTFEKQT